MTRFFPRYIIDTVLEYRSYALVFLWAVLAGWVAGRPGEFFRWWLLWFLVGYWAVVSRRRSRYYSSALSFWGQAWRECPDKPRVLTHYAENVLLEIERECKAGKSWDELQPLIELGLKLENDVTLLPAALEQSKNVAVNPWLNGRPPEQPLPFTCECGRDNTKA